jgi:hypothetical protein
LAGEYVDEDEAARREADGEMMKEIEQMNIDIYNLKIEIGTNFLQ